MNARNSIAVLEFDSAKIRVTTDGRVSVIDMIAACGFKRPHDAWAYVKKQFTEKTDNFKFPGERQRLTPVATKEQVIKILMVMPKAVKVDAFREWASSILVRYLDGDISLAEEIFELTQASPEDQARSAARINGKASRNLLTATIKDRGTKHIFGLCTNATYDGMFDTDATGLRKMMNLTTKDNPRDHMDMGNVLAIGLAEWKAAQQIKKDDIHGDRPCATVCKQSAQQVRSIL
jgi:hypothetical protein